MLGIESPVEGQICNRWDGDVRDDGLRIAVRGTCAPGAAVAVNGVPAAVTADRFEAHVVLRPAENEIRAASTGEDPVGVRVFYDAAGVRRVRISVDDCIYFLRDTALYARESLFDNGFLAFWRGFHREFGTKVHFNIYFDDLDTGFSLASFPDRFRKEWEANADWLRLTFHARADRPDRPYQQADYEAVDRDFKLVTREITRFAGPAVLSTSGTLHWGTATVDGCRALHDNGMTCLVGYFEVREGRPFVAYYLDAEQTAHLNARDYWVDTHEGITFVKHDLVMDPIPLAEIPPSLDAIHADPHRSEVLELLVHEQYFYPRWHNYRPEQAMKVRTALAWAAEHGYRPVLYDEGAFAGA